MITYSHYMMYLNTQNRRVHHVVEGHGYEMIYYNVEYTIT